jgi:hypothetical protein
LKNYALLLFGPSPFEHWFKSCKLFAVRSLFFSDIAKQSSASFFPLLLPGAPAPLCSARGASAAGAVHRPWSPAPTSCFSPRPRVTSLSFHHPNPPAGASPARHAALRHCNAARRRLCHRRASVVHPPPPGSNLKPMPCSPCSPFPPQLPIKGPPRTSSRAHRTLLPSISAAETSVHRGARTSALSLHKPTAPPAFSSSTASP